MLCALKYPQNMKGRHTQLWQECVLPATARLHYGKQGDCRQANLWFFGAQAPIALKSYYDGSAFLLINIFNLSFLFPSKSCCFANNPSRILRSFTQKCTLAKTSATRKERASQPPTQEVSYKSICNINPPHHHFIL